MNGTGPGQNCVLVENGNYFELGTQLEQVVSELEKDGSSYDTVIRKAIETAHGCADLDKEAQSLERFFKSLG